MTTYPVRFPAQLRQHLRALRKSRGLTQKNVAALIGVSQARIAEIEANPGLVSFEQLIQLLAALGVTITLCESNSLSHDTSDESEPETNLVEQRRPSETSGSSDRTEAAHPAFETTDAADLAWNALAEINESNVLHSAKNVSSVPSEASNIDLLRTANSALDALRNYSSDADLLGKVNSLSDALRNVSNDADFLRRANSASDVLRNASVDADLLRTNSAADVLRNAGRDADLLRKANSASDALRKAHEELSVSSSYRNILDRSKKGSW